ncbi:MAG: hypothetical protein JWO74_1107 [Solirubrobacterales bacterium]|nr:hypothetical protein [Solirubrobacterales bacterium]
MAIMDPQLPLFVSRATHLRDLAVVRSRARREVAVAVGQLGDQLAMTLWRAERVARAVEAMRACPRCAPGVERALADYADAPTGRRPPATRVLPVRGWAS